MAIAMAFSGVELPPLLSFFAIASVIFVYLVICCLILEYIGENGEPHEEPLPADARFSGLSYEDLQEMGCFYHRGEEKPTCAICLDCLREAELCRSFPGCNHVFHAQCIDPWLARRHTCPTCRASFRPKLLY
ncbi:RING-H2 finger protein ATL56-like [Ipomoea triloba]|uniref:RING-H2 finger protein ATL56-like n=1 Tax=Ipomoea triloba TaxID=35885 RepID=UPI00125D34CA|nr:RING-H2 finger protein ATL56-like [Ipomoea triloba]